MAKKKTTKSRRTAAASAPKKKVTKKTTKKKVAKKVTKKKATQKKAAPKKAAKKAVTKKKTTQKTVAKKVAKKVTKKTTKKKTTAKKTVTKKTPVKKAPTKKAPTKKAVTKKAPTKKAPPRPVYKRPEPVLSPLELAMQQDWTIPKLKRVKTGLSKKDLNDFLQLLLEKRSEIIGNVQGMEDARNAALADIAHMPLHMADVGSDNFEQEFTLGLMESEREMLREIEDAIVRMREGYYGVCLDSGQPINRARLEIKPWAKYCIEVARMHEKRGW